MVLPSLQILVFKCKKSVNSGNKEIKRKEHNEISFKVSKLSRASSKFSQNKQFDSTQLYNSHRSIRLTLKNKLM